MIAVKEMRIQGISLNKSLSFCGVSKAKWYHTRKPRNVSLNETIVQMVQTIGSSRPTYGTRRMAAMLSRKLGRAVNRKQIQRTYRKLGWIVPAKTKSEIIKSGRKMFKPTGPNHLWQTDMTYIWCGIDGWCYLFNVIDTFTRKWVGYSFDVSATKDAAVQCVVNAIASEKPDCTKLLIRTDNGSQYISHKFRQSIQALGARQEFIYHHTPEQNGHIESFHHTLKKEYIWPHEFASYQDAEIVIADAFLDYNQSRIHSALGYLTPNEFAKSRGMKNK